MSNQKKKKKNLERNIVVYPRSKIMAEKVNCNWNGNIYELCPRLESSCYTGVYKIPTYCIVAHETWQPKGKEILCPTGVPFFTIFSGDLTCLLNSTKKWDSRFSQIDWITDHIMGHPHTIYSIRQGYIFWSIVFTRFSLEDL